MNVLDGHPGLDFNTILASFVPSDRYPTEEYRTSQPLVTGSFLAVRTKCFLLLYFECITKDLKVNKLVFVGHFREDSE